LNEKPTILIVDDDEANILLLEYILGKEKYNTISCFNADKALAIINEQQIDILLSDVMMPGMDGFELTMEIRKNPKTRLIPIVLLTGLEETQFRIKGIEAGCDDFITKPSLDCVKKPFYKEEVLSRVKMLLQMNYYRLQINEKEKFELLLNGIGDGYLLINKNGTINKSNIKAREWLLFSENVGEASFKDQIGKFFILEDKETIFDTIPYYNMSFEIERPKTSQYNQLILECRSFPYRENYELENLLILIHDITDQKKEFRSKTAFFSSLVHIMNSQINGIQSSMEKVENQNTQSRLEITLELDLKLYQLSKY
jgi:CheY-like chemotaxis protein